MKHLPPDFHCFLSVQDLYTLPWVSVSTQVFKKYSYMCKADLLFSVWQLNLMIIAFVSNFNSTNTIILSCHEQAFLSGLRFERYFSHHQATWMIMSHIFKVNMPTFMETKLRIRRSCAKWLIKIIGQIKVIRQ